MTGRDRISLDEDGHNLPAGDRMKRISEMVNILTGTTGSGNPYAGGERRIARPTRRRKPTGSTRCQCGRTISASKTRCRKCKEAQP